MAFERIKTTLANRKSGSKPPPTTKLGGLALQETQEATKQPEKSYADELSERLRSLREAHKEFLKQTVEKNIPEADLPQVTADAMNAGAIPRIIPGLSFRGSGFSLEFLDGQIPPEALAVKANTDPETGRFSGGIYIARDPKPGDGFTIEGSGNLPQISQPGDPIDVAMLAKIDAHMAAPTPNQ
jgi:hypothetical protein